MPGTPQHMFILRLALATMLALYVPWVFGPDDLQYRMYAVSLALLTVLGGGLRHTTKEGGLMGEMATAAMVLLLLAPAVGIRTSRVADAVFTATHIAPHKALFQLPAIAQTVPLASGPLLAGAGLAIIAICGRLGAVYAGIAFGAATAAWVGQTMAIEAETAMLAERFEDAVLYSQAMRFVGLTVLLGAVGGFPFYQRGKRAWREAMHDLIHAERMARAQAERDEEIARVKAAHSELKAREAAEEAKRAKEEEESAQGVTIDDLDGGEGPVDAAEERPVESDEAGEGGGFGEEDHEIENEPDDDDDGAAPEDPRTDDAAQEADSGEAGSEDPEDAPASEPVLPPLELEPRFDIESPIVIEVAAEESDPDADLAADVVARMRRVIGGLLVICGLAAGWTATPPWFEVLEALPDVSTHVAVPVTDPGLSIARPPMDPFSKTFDEELARRGHGRLHGAPWSCLADSAAFGRNYGSTERAIQQLAVPADTPVIDLYPAVELMRRRGVYRMGLIGRSDPPYGPLGALFAWPSVQLLLDRPPRALQWFQLSARQIEELGLLPGRGGPKGCVLMVDDTATVEHLFNATRSLGSRYGDKRCKGGIALVFPEDGSTTNSNPAWRGCP
jgi:hypothetical protein